MATTQETKAKGTRPEGARPAPKKGQKVDSTMAAPWKPKDKNKPGDILEGRYLGAEMVPGKGTRKPFKSYHVEQPNGERVRIASAMLNSKMNQVPKGAYIWLEYKGMFDTTNGPSPDYELTVEEGVELLDPLQDSEALVQ